MYYIKSAYINSKLSISIIFMNESTLFQRSKGDTYQNHCDIGAFVFSYNKGKTFVLPLLHIPVFCFFLCSEPCISIPTGLSSALHGSLPSRSLTPLKQRGTRTYSSIALILLTPAEEDCSFLILKCPIVEVFSTWGPPQTSLEKSPIE